MQRLAVKTVNSLQDPHDGRLYECSLLDRPGVLVDREDSAVLDQGEAGADVEGLGREADHEHRQPPLLHHAYQLGGVLQSVEWLAAGDDDEGLGVGQVLQEEVQSAPDARVGLEVAGNAAGDSENDIPVIIS